MSDLPRMPDGDARTAGRDLDALVRFHRTGESADVEPPELRPALIGEVLEPGRRFEHYPLVLLDGDDPPDAGSSVVSLSALIAQALASDSAGDESAGILSEQIPRLARAVERTLHHGPLRQALEKARGDFVAEFDLSEAGASALQEEIDRLEAALPDSGTVVGPGLRTLLELYASAIRRERRAAEGRFLDDARAMVLRLDGLLWVDATHGPDGMSSGALSGELGTAGAAHVDTERLSHLLPEHRGPTRLPAERRERVAQARDTLQQYLRLAKTGPQVVIVHSGAWPRGLDLARVETIEASNALERAAAAFDEQAERMAQVFRAARIARLELEGAYEPARHDAALARFDWRSVKRDELRLLPQVAVLERAETVRRAGVGALSELLVSARPVHALLLEHPLLQGAAEGDRLHLELGYLAAAHREVFVLQSTLAQPPHLGAGFARMVGSPRPAVAVVAVPSDESELPPVLELAVAHEARATPCFRYDPESGDTWAVCFDLDGNPQVERAWPVHELRYLDDQDVECVRAEAFTFAHAAAMDPAFRRHFRPVPAEDWSDAQVEIADYLALAEPERRLKLPFIWTVDDERRLARVVMTYELAQVCRDRSKTWRIFRELAGVDNEYARRAAEESMQRLVTMHEEELGRIREEAGQQAVRRLVNVLVGIEPPPGAAAEGAATPAVQSPAVADEAAAEMEAEPVLPDEPYIDMALCTTCNECTNLNPRMFRYNDNKQAYIADASAGTFKELVKAAEKCPARCIHPGSPRPDDSTVNDRLLARAAKFN
jgi:ferredoxin